jgi:lipid-binding SYLF domain-containing protein
MSFPEGTMRYVKASPVTTLGLLTLCFESAGAEDAFENDATATLKSLYRSEPIVRVIGEKAKAVLVFPNIVKAGFIVRRQYGEGVLLVNGIPIAHYGSEAVSFGLQAGMQSFGYALFLMNENALRYLDESDGWELGGDPSIIIVDNRIAKSLRTTTWKENVYAFIFDQQGLMAGLGIQGSKITKLEK